MLQIFYNRLSQDQMTFLNLTGVMQLYEGCPKMLYNCIISLEFKTKISLIHMHPIGNLFLDILLKLHKIS